MNVKVGLHKEKHEFAFFVEGLSSFIDQKKEKNEFVLVDEALVHRIAVILRLQIGEICILFDHTIHIQCVIAEFIGKKQIKTIIQSRHNNKIFLPEITFLLPLLKRDDYENALYSLAEVGVNTIQLVTTKKTTTAWTSKDNDRAMRLLISAAEQSKNFSIPFLKPPVTLASAIQADMQKKMFFDSQGVDFWTGMTSLHREKPQQIMILIGPEGDLSSEEKNMVREQGFMFYSLTPTILRSVQAAALSAGFVRSLLTHQSF